MVGKTLGHYEILWLHARLWPGLVGYWLVCTVGAGAIARAGGAGAENGWIILVMLVLVSICMGTERGDWQIWKRVSFVPLVFLFHMPLSVVAMILIVPLGLRPELVERAGTFVASLPFAIFAMRRSWLFVASTEEPERDDSVVASTTASGNLPSPPLVDAPVPELPQEAQKRSPWALSYAVPITPALETDDRLFCTQCGTRGAHGDRFCASCGSRFKST